MSDKNTVDSDLAKAKKNEYYRKWRAANKEKVKASNERYWARKYERDLLKESEEAHGV